MALRAFLYKTAVFIFATATGFSAAGLHLGANSTGPRNTATALGAAAGLLPLIIFTETKTWPQYAVFFIYHVSAWILFLIGPLPGMVFGISTALFAASLFQIKSVASPSSKHGGLQVQYSQL